MMETATQTTAKWIALSERLSPEGQLVMTKIDDGKGVRNEQSLVRRGVLWFTDSPDAMYVYYAPTHWKPLTPAPQETPAQLLPCPFCGSEAAFTHQGLSLDLAYDGDVYGRVYCTEGRFRCCPELQYEPNQEDEQNAFKEWNTRYRDPAFQKLVEVTRQVEAWLTIRKDLTGRLQAAGDTDFTEQARRRLSQHSSSAFLRFLGTEPFNELVAIMASFAAEAATAALEQELDLLLRRVGELGLDGGFSSHYQHGFEMFRNKMRAVIKARIAAIGDDREQQQ